jgi:uncharacterized membrane protein
MNSGLALLLAFGIGVVAGLRSMTVPAIVAWAAHLGWINLSGSRLAFWAQPGPSASSVLAHWANSLLINCPPLPPVRLPSRSLPEL